MIWWSPADAPQSSWCLRARTQFGAGAFPGIPDCCLEHDHQTRLFRSPRGAAPCPADPGGAMETIFERVSALDVHKEQVTACVRVPEESGPRVEKLAEFATTVPGLLGMLDWLGGRGGQPC